MRILIVGDPNLIWNYKYIKNVLVGSGHDVTVMYYGQIKKGYKDFYNANNIRIVAAPSAIIPVKFSSIIRRLHLKWAKITRKYDCIHLQYITRKSLEFAVSARWKECRMIATPWGSDILRASTQELQSRVRYLDEFNYITIPSDKILEEMRKLYGNRYDRKYKFFLKLGLDIFESLDRVLNQYSIEDCKRKFGFDSHSIVIGIGYNGSRDQQHISVLKEVSILPVEIKKRIELVMHVSYSLPTDGYREEIKEAAETSGCKYHIIDDYLYNDDMAQLRNATDIFIHAQKTDEYSAAVQEYLYCGALLLNPSWIPYGELVERGIQYTEYQDFSDMRIKLQQTIEQFKERELRSDDYKHKLYELSSWDSYRGGWRKLYE